MRHWLKMGCGSSHHAVEKDLRSKHETQASAAIRPAYLKPTTDALGLSNEQFEMATRVFLHFDEVRRAGCCRTSGSHTIVGPRCLFHTVWFTPSGCLAHTVSTSRCLNHVCRIPSAMLAGENGSAQDCNGSLNRSEIKEIRDELVRRLGTNQIDCIQRRG